MSCLSSLVLGAHGQGTLYDPPLLQVYPPQGYGSSRPVPLEPRALFPFLSWLDQPPWDHTPRTSSTYMHCSSVTRVTLYFVQKGLAVPLILSFAKPFVPLAAVYVCMRVCVFICSFIAYLLSAHCVPGTVAESLWVCLLMLLLLLWGPLSGLSSSPNCYLCQSGCLRFCASCMRFSPSLSLCRALFVSLSLPWCLTLPLCPLVTLGL